MLPVRGSGSQTLEQCGVIMAPEKGFCGPGWGLVWDGRLSGVLCFSMGWEMLQEAGISDIQAGK